MEQRIYCDIAHLQLLAIFSHLFHLLFPLSVSLKTLKWWSKLLIFIDITSRLLFCQHECISLKLESTFSLTEFFFILNNFLLLRCHYCEYSLYNAYTRKSNKKSELKFRIEIKIHIGICPFRKELLSGTLLSLISSVVGYFS